MAIHRRVEWIWPTITDIPSAQKASKQGLWASAWCAGATLVFVVLSVFGVSLYGFDLWALIDVLFFILIGWGIYKMNRFAAVAGLTLYIIERAAMWSEYGPKNPIVAILISLMFINSIRDIFAYHRYGKEEQASTTGV